MLWLVVVDQHTKTFPSTFEITSPGRRWRKQPWRSIKLQVCRKVSIFENQMLHRDLVICCSCCTCILRTCNCSLGHLMGLVQVLSNSGYAYVEFYEERDVLTLIFVGQKHWRALHIWNKDWTSCPCISWGRQGYLSFEHRTDWWKCHPGRELRRWYGPRQPWGLKQNGSLVDV